MSNNFRFFSVVFFILVSIIAVQLCYAADDSNTRQGNPTPVKLTNPLTGTQDSEGIPLLLGKIINYAMGIIGSLALVMFIYGGLTWMLSGGSQEQVTKGKNIVIWATLGLAIIFTSYALVKFVIEAFK
ncbi:MAG: pilin [bacterium]|nr:pilin [bacterium]